MTDEPVMSGGCQCGAIRYRIHARPHDPHICHCRMCQKAFGSFFAPLASVPADAFEITRGELAIFASSGVSQRGFCRNCGTPLTLRDGGEADRVFFSIGSLDHPEAVAPERQYGVESRMPYFETLAGLPGESTTEDDNPELARQIKNANHQHPDRDTDTWPPA